jgi:hypothetical protein
MLRVGVHRNVQSIRTFINHKVLPLITTYDNYLAGKNPDPSDGSVVKYGERYYRTFADIPNDKGFKEDINILKSELDHLKDPVKNFDKIKTIYDKVISKLEEEKKAQEEKERIRTLVRNTASTFSPSPVSSVSQLSLKQTGSQVNSRAVALRQLMRKPFEAGTPDIMKHRDLYSSDRVTPAKLRSKGTISEVLGEDEGEDEGIELHKCCLVSKHHNIHRRSRRLVYHQVINLIQTIKKNYLVLFVFYTYNITTLNTFVRNICLIVQCICRHFSPVAASGCLYV